MLTQKIIRQNFSSSIIDFSLDLTEDATAPLDFLPRIKNSQFVKIESFTHRKEPEVPFDCSTFKAREPVTPFDDHDRSLSSKNRLYNIITRAQRESSIPFIENWANDLYCLMEPDSIYDQDPLSPETVDHFLQFMRQSANWLSESPRLSGGVNGALTAGWRRSKLHYLFIYFMRNGDIQYTTSNVDSSRISGYLVEADEQKHMQLKIAFCFFCTGNRNVS